MKGHKIAKRIPTRFWYLALSIGVSRLITAFIAGASAEIFMTWVLKASFDVDSRFNEASMLGVQIILSN